MLDGEWEFCRGRLLDSSDFAKSGNRDGCGFIRVPGLWKDQMIGGVAVPAQGHATYRLKIICGPDEREKTLSLLRVFSAYGSGLTGRLADQAGSVGRSPKAEESFVFVHNVTVRDVHPGTGDERNRVTGCQLSPRFRRHRQVL